MIEKIYEVSCDLCGRGINHYVGHRPSIQDFWKDKIKHCYENGKLRIYCDECFEKI